MTKENEKELRSWLDSHITVIGPRGGSSNDPKTDDGKWSAHDSKQAIINAFVKRKVKDA